MTEYVINVTVTPKTGSNLKVVIRGEAYPKPIAGLFTSLGAPMFSMPEPVRIAQEIEEVDTNDRIAVSEAVDNMKQRLITACNKRARYLEIVDSYQIHNVNETLSR